MEEDDEIDRLYAQVIVLNDTMKTLNLMVAQQQQEFDTLEDVILTPKQDVHVSCTTLVTADHYQRRTNWYYYAAGFVASIGTTISLLFLL